MKSCIHSLCIALLLLFATHATGQGTTAKVWFDQAAHEYVKKDRLTALRTLDKGLREHPGDAALLNLAEALLKDEQQEEKQEQKEQQKQDQEKKEQEEKEGQDKKEDGKEKGEEKKEQQEIGQQEKQQGGQQEQGKKEEEQRMQMSPQDARRILDALERQESEVQEKARERLRPAVPKPIEKDW